MTHLPSFISFCVLMHIPAQPIQTFIGANKIKFHFLFFHILPEALIREWRYLFDELTSLKSNVYRNIDNLTNHRLAVPPVKLHFNNA